MYRARALTFLLGLTLLLASGCAQRRLESLTQYPYLLRASDPGWSGLDETFYFLGKGGVGDWSQYPFHLRGGVDGSAIPRSVSSLFTNRYDKSHRERFWWLLTH